MLNGGLYISDFGEVRVSFTEAHLLRAVENGLRTGHDIPGGLWAKYCALRKSIDRVAAWKMDHA